jgi:hypothetical protein
MLAPTLTTALVACQAHGAGVQVWQMQVTVARCSVHALTCSDLKDVSRSVSVSIEKNLSFSNFVAQYCLCAAHATHMHSAAITRRGHHGSPWPWWSVLASLFSMECFGLSIVRPEALGTLCCPRPFAWLPAATVAGRVGGIAGSLAVWLGGRVAAQLLASNHTAPPHARVQPNDLAIVTKKSVYTQVHEFSSVVCIAFT